MPSADTDRYDSFVIRIWTRDRVFVQGQATHVVSRRSVYFRDVQRLIGFMLGHAQNGQDSQTSRDSGARVSRPGARKPAGQPGS
jgi:hypothetical protein